MISIIIPVLNEEKAIAATINDCKNLIHELADQHSELIIVDDASDDKTPKIIKQYDVKIISHTKNEGYGRSVKDGILAAVNDIILICDADGTYPVEKAKDLLGLLGMGADMAVGERIWSQHKESFFRKTVRKCLRAMVEFFSESTVPDVNSGFRMFSKKQVLPFLDDLCDTFSFTTSLTFIYLLKGKKIEYYPVEYRKRTGSSKIRFFRDSIITLHYIFRSVKKHSIIKLMQFLMLFLIMAGIAGSVFFLIFYHPLMFWSFVSYLLITLIALLFLLLLKKID